MCGVHDSTNPPVTTRCRSPRAGVGRCCHWSATRMGTTYRPPRG